MHKLYLSMSCEHVLLIDDHAYMLTTLSHDYDINHTCNIIIIYYYYVMCVLLSLNEEVCATIFFRVTNMVVNIVVMTCRTSLNNLGSIQGRLS